MDDAPSIANRHACWLPSEPKDGALFVWGEGEAGEVDRTIAAPEGERKVRGRLLDAEAAGRWLLSLPEDGAGSGEDVLFWRAGVRLAIELILEERVLPGLERDGAARARWRPMLDAPSAAERAAALEAAMPESCRLSGGEAVLSRFLGAVVDAQMRGAAREAGVSPSSAVAPEDAWLGSLIDASPELYATPAELAELEASLRSWRSRLETASGGGLRVGLRLRAPKGAGRWPLEYFLQSLEDPSLIVEARGVWSGSRAARRLERLTGADAEERLLAALAVAGRLFYPIERSLLDPEPTAASLDLKEAHAFLKQAAPALASAGFGVFLPAWWRTSGAPRLSVKVALRPRSEASSALGLRTVVKVDYAIALGGKKLSKRELDSLARLKTPLVRLRGRWIEADPETIRKTLEHWGGAGDDATLGEVFDRFRAPEEASGLPVEDLEAEGWTRELFAPLGPREFRLEPAPPGFVGTLRPYQLRGFSWLAFLGSSGFGACLADDMGLGKTVQTLAFLLHEKSQGRLRFPALLVCPTSVVTNWKKEAERFAPGLRVGVHHGPERRRAARGFGAEVRGLDLVVTTYAVARLDQGLLDRPWSGIVLDEAQNIKNPSARQSRAARGLRGRFRIALTGTPVENRLSELWSILQFLNPGQLGGFEEFRRRFAIPIERFKDERASGVLRELTRPFLLRRLKTDPGIAPELPAKLEMKVFCSITKEQASLYRAVVREMLSRIASSEGASRRGLVLAAITRLKQVLNHPAQLLKQTGPLAGRSGKLERLTEMLEEALSEGDSALVFTQFAEMGELLRRHLQAALSEETLYFHGALAKGARDRLVERFQQGRARLMVLTLKAGGFGLNLTRASHVFHFDRWWNPAVEAQAADRVYRIGQSKKVQVRRFVCAGTLEEGIDRLIEEKTALARRVLGAGESWLAELSDEKLRELFILRAEAEEGAS